MQQDELVHYGVKGMKWGVRRTLQQLGHLAKGITRRTAAVRKKAPSKAAKPKAKTYTDDELRAMINRLELEKKYRELSTPESQKRAKKGREFVSDILESSAKNIGKQLVTYGMGEAVNQLLGANVVNPKKGQKDK